MTSAVRIRPVRDGDHSQWLELWESYNRFYRRVIPDAVTQATWSRLFDGDEPVFGLVAESEGRLVGLVHYIFHRSTALLHPVCYLQDLFTSAETRGRGIGGSLIEAVYARAQEAGSARVYWLTHETNETARRLYDAVADRSGFIQYRKDLGT